MLLLILTELGSTTEVKKSLCVHQKLSSSKSTSCVATNRAKTKSLQPSRSVEDEFHAKVATVPPCTSVQQKKSHTKSSRMVKSKKPQPLAKQLMHKISISNPFESKTSTLNDREDMINMTRSLQDISNFEHLPNLNHHGAHFNSDSDVSPSPVYENLSSQVPLITTAVMTNVSHSAITKPDSASASSSSSSQEDIYENVNSLTSSKRYTMPAG